MPFSDNQLVLLHAIVALHNMEGNPTPAALQLEQTLSYLVAEFVIVPKECDMPDHSLA
jgi:hypothetical protein